MNIPYAPLLAFIRHRARILAFIILCAMIIGVYVPSLYHIARGDHIGYLAEMSSRHGFFDTVLGTFDLNRTRLFSQGDEMAFRPLLYVVLGLEKYFFKYDFFWWQLIGLAAHLFASGALYAFMCRVRGGSFAFLATAFFAFLPINIEAVTWHHISAYLVFAGCVVMALRDLFALTRDRERAMGHGGAALAWMVPAVFLYEAGVAYVLMMGVFLWFQRQRLLACGAWALAGIFLALDLADILWRRVTVISWQGPVDVGHWIDMTLRNIALLGKWFLCSALFLDGKDLVLVSRALVREEVVGWAWPLGQALTGGIVGGVVVLVLGLVWGLHCRCFREGARKNAGLLGLCAAMAIGYLAIIALGRIDVLGAQGIRVCLYYPYNFLVLIFVMMALVSGGGADTSGLRARIVKGVCVAGIGMVIIFNAATIARVTQGMVRDNAIYREFLVALDRYVRAHEHEPDFSFYIAPDYPGNYNAYWVARTGDPAGMQYTVAQALYLPYFRNRYPKYNITLGR